MRPRCAAVVVCFVVALGAVVAIGAPVSAQTGVSAEDIAVRDQLIADQENLLNTYRCLFGTDTDLVPGGCDNPDTIAPGAIPQNPTQHDLDVRPNNPPTLYRHLHRHRYRRSTYVRP